MKKRKSAKPKPVGRDDPKRARRLDLEVGSEHEIGRELLNVLRDEGDGGEIVAAEGRLWEYVKARGQWVAVPEDELHRIVGTFDGTEYRDGGRPKTLRISDAFARGAIRRAEIQASAPSFFVNTTPVLVFTNCAVRLRDDGEIERLLHSPEHRARVGYSFPFDPHAKCAGFLKMMREHFEGDADAQQKIDCEQEFFGGCLFGIAVMYQKCLAMPSDGGGGRSTLLEAIEGSFPVGTVSHIEAKDLRSAERRTRLVGKRLNFSDEVPPDAFIESEDFKKVVTGNVVTAEGKYRASFEFRPVAGHVFPIQVSASAELSMAFFRRFCIIRYNRCFEGDPSRDLHLAKRLVQDETPGIVRWLVEGAARLRRQGQYTVPASHHQESLRWRVETDTVTAFVAATMVRATFPEPRNKKRPVNAWDRHDWTYSSDLYGLYQHWCTENGHRKPVASGRFGERLKKIPVRSKHGEKGTAYAIISRELAESREKRRAEHERREPRSIAGFLDEPALTLVAAQPDSLTDSITTVPSGEMAVNSNDYNEADMLTGRSQDSYTKSKKRVPGKPVRLSGRGSRSQKEGDLL